MDVQENEQVALPGLEQITLPMGQRYSSFGKQVTLLQTHYADAVSTDAAANISTALNAADMQQDWAKLIAQVR